MSSLIINPYAIAPPPATNIFDSSIMKGWWDASDAGTIHTGAANRIQTWDDKMGTNNLSAPSDVTRPGTGTTTENSLNVLTFDGTQAMLKSSASGMPTAAQGRTIAITVKQTAGTAAIYTHFVGGTTDFELSESGTFKIFGRGTHGTVAGSDNFVLLSGVATTNLRAIYKNGTAGTPDSSSDANSGTVDLIQLGFAAGGAFIMAGTIGEILVMTGTGDTNRIIAEGYLAWKWGLDDDLDAGHLYKSAPPTF